MPMLYMLLPRIYAKIDFYYYILFKKCQVSSGFFMKANFAMHISKMLLFITDTCGVAEEVTDLFQATVSHPLTCVCIVLLRQIILKLERCWNTVIDTERWEGNLCSVKLHCCLRKLILMSLQQIFDETRIIRDRCGIM